MTVPPDWKLPTGVNAALWEYSHTPRLAREEDHYFAGHPLFEADAFILTERFREPGRLVDLGSGTGRLALQFARRGFSVVAVELSHSMLQTVGEKADRERVAVARVEANLCRLGCFRDGSFEYAISMFSTLGMIRGSSARRRALEETCRILKPGGRLALHAHNIWLNLREGQGRRWLVEDALQSLLHKTERGDRRMTYRGIPGMEVHLYHWRELKRELEQAGFRIEEVIPIDAVHARPITAPWFLHSLRAGGWVVFARRTPR